MLLIVALLIAKSGFIVKNKNPPCFTAKRAHLKPITNKKRKT